MHNIKLSGYNNSFYHKWQQLYTQAFIKEENMSQQQNMKIDSKNLSYIEDTLNMEALACRKYDMYAAQITDANSRKLVTQLSQHHRQRFDSLFGYLNSHN